MAGRPIEADRIVRLHEWEVRVQTERGAAEFLTECASSRNLREVAARLNLPTARVVAFLAAHADLSEQAKEAILWYSHQCAAEVVPLADELVDEGLTLERRDVLERAVKHRMEARKWTAAKLNRPAYGDSLQVQHTGETVVRLTFGGGGPVVPALVGESSVVEPAEDDMPV